MKRSTTVFLFLAALTLGGASSSFGGLLDSPVPTLGGQPARVVFYVPGVTKNNGIETEFMCTVPGIVGARIGVEVFDSAGTGPLNDVSAGDGEQAVPAGGGITIGTGTTLGFHEDEIIVSVPANIRGGSARIVSTAKSVFCQAFLVEDAAATPALIAPLKVIAKRQSGD